MAARRSKVEERFGKSWRENWKKNRAFLEACLAAALDDVERYCAEELEAIRLLNEDPGYRSLRERINPEGGDIFFRLEDIPDDPDRRELRDRLRQRAETNVSIWRPFQANVGTSGKEIRDRYWAEADRSLKQRIDLPSELLQKYRIDQVLREIPRFAEMGEKGFVADLWARAKAALNFDIVGRLATQTVDVSFAALSDRLESGFLQAEFSERGSAILSSHDPFSITAVRAVHGLRTDDLAFLPNYRRALLRLCDQGGETGRGDRGLIDIHASIHEELYAERGPEEEMDEAVFS